MHVAPVLGSYTVQHQHRVSLELSLSDRAPVSGSPTVFPRRNTSIGLVYSCLSSSFSIGFSNRCFIQTQHQCRVRLQSTLSHRAPVSGLPTVISQTEYCAVSGLPTVISQTEYCAVSGLPRVVSQTEQSAVSESCIHSSSIDCVHM